MKDEWEWGLIWEDPIGSGCMIMGVGISSSYWLNTVGVYIVIETARGIGLCD